VWDRLLDHQFVGSCGPGIESVSPIDDTHYQVVAAFGAGNIKLRFSLDVSLVDLDPPSSVSMVARGKAPGSAVHVTSGVTLEPVAPDHTMLRWHAESAIHGKMASIGARLLKSVTRKLTNDFWEEFAKRVNSDA
jgi:uncharacterized protein